MSGGPGGSGRRTRTDATYDVVGIGNALVDVLSNESDDFIHHHSLAKGSMTLIETDQAQHLYSVMGPGIEVSGGSAANTMCGLASFGARVSYLGKVADDELVSSDVILPPRDISFEEACAEFTGDGLIPD